MVKAKVVEGRSRAERKQRRKHLGTLQGLTVKPATLKRYRDSVREFFQYLKYEELQLPQTKTAFDAQLGQYITHLWEEGDSRYKANDTVCGLQHAQPAAESANFMATSEDLGSA